VRAIDEDEVVARLDPSASELVPERVVQEPRVARLLEDDFDSGTEAGLLDHTSCRRPATLSAPPVDGGQRAESVGFEGRADVDGADPVPDAEFETVTRTVLADEPVQLLAALGRDPCRQSVDEVGHLRHGRDGHRWRLDAVVDSTSAGVCALGSAPVPLRDCPV